MAFRNRQIQSFSDLELIKKYKVKGHQQYLGELFKRYMPLVFGVCMKYLKNEAKAKDATMNIYERCVTKLAETEVEQFKPWLYVVVKNFCLMQLRKEKSRPREIELTFDKADEMNGYDYLKEEKITLMIQKLDGIKKEQRDCLTLFFLRNKSYKEVALDLGIEIKKVKSHIQNGKRNLRILLEQESAFNN